MVKVLVFDTETTDIPPEMPGRTWDERDKQSKNLLSFSDFKKKKSMWSQYVETWPSIIQLSYILYDTEEPLKAKIVNKYIDIPEDVKISEGSMKIHHITREKIASAASVNKAKIYDALDEFMNDVSKADTVVGHNVQFDRKMIIAELTRVSKEHNMPQIKEMMNDNNFECTMEQTKAICNLKIRYENIDKKTGESRVFYKVKSPKLMESYKHFFGYEPAGESLHDAIVDVVVCLRVYCMTLDEPIDVCGTNKQITDYIKAFSPPGYDCNGEVNITTPELVPRSPPKPKSRKTAKRSSASSRKTKSNRILETDDNSESGSKVKKHKLHTIMEETKSSSSHKSSINISKKASKLKSPAKTKLGSDRPKRKSASSRKYNNEMDDFIVSDDYTD